MAADATSYDHLLKLLLVGDSNVGKTSLLLSFTSDSFKDNVRNTVGVDLKVKIINHPATGKTLKLTIWVSISYLMQIRASVSTYTVSLVNANMNVSWHLGYMYTIHCVAVLLCSVV